MAELEQELAARWPRAAREAAQPKALPMAEEDDSVERSSRRYQLGRVAKLGQLFAHRRGAGASSPDNGRCHDTSVRTGRTGQGLRSRRGRGRAQPRLRLSPEGARLAEARLGRSLFLPSDRGRRHPDRPQARHRLDRHRPAARHGRGHGRRRATRSSACSAASSPGWSTASPSFAARAAVRRAPSRRRTCASSCWRCRRTSACCWSSSPTGCTTCARCTSSRSRRSAGASRARRWRSTRRWPSASACRRSSDELEELAFAELNPDGRDVDPGAPGLSARAAASGSSRDRSPSSIKTLDRTAGSTAQVSGREKTPYSIWRKMQRKNVGFEQLADIMAFRVVVGTIEDCYQALRRASTAAGRSCPAGSRTTSRPPSPTATARSTPRVIGPGAAAHRDADPHRARCTRWPSSASPRTGATSRATASTDGRQYRWLRELLEILEHGAGRRGVARAHQAGDVPGPGVLLHAEGRADRAAARRDAGRLRLRRPHPRSATPASAPRSTAAWCRCAPSSRTATRSRSSPSQGADAVADLGALRRHRQGAARIRRFVRTQQRQQYLELGPAMLDKAFREEGYEVPRRPRRRPRKLQAATTDDLLRRGRRGPAYRRARC